MLTRLGSSPRVRGKQGRPTHQHVVHRIIPARAGQTDSRAGRRSSRPDHPRACGANFRAGFLMFGVPGSSPRVRGKLVVDFLSLDLHRIIPARAGQTPFSWSICRPPADHPRACGANLVGVVLRLHYGGSSPRVRGKHVAAKPVEIQRRIIPARAGQTHCTRASWPTSPDHPRACGANPPLTHGAPARFGSSPRVRGKRPDMRRGTRCRPDHPRACGANSQDTVSDQRENGSSPRVRGKLGASAAQGAMTTDHPRACGANSPILCENS